MFQPSQDARQTERRQEGPSLVVQRLVTLIDKPQPDPWMAAYSPTTDIRRKDLDHASFEGTVLNDEQKKEPSFSYIRSYILPYSRSRRWERVVRLLEYFCKGADVSLDHFVTYQLPGQSDQHQATAWVSDRNEINQSSSAPSNFERVLSAPELYKVLQQKKLLREEPANNTAICRALRIYINHANGLCILGLIKTAPLWQAQGFRELLSYYVLTPKPRIRVYQSSWWNGCFIMHFNIPFHAISNSDRKDTRTIRDKGELRHRFDLSFLDPSNSTDVRTGDRPGSIGPAFLHQVTCSFMLTGRSESDWTAVCLNEDSFDDQQKLNTDDELETDGLGPDGEVDPILDEPSLNGVHLPRPYGLAFLANQFVTVVEHQWDIEHQFGESLERNSPDSVGELPGQLSAKDIKQWTRQSVNRLEMVRNSISILVGELDRFLELQVIFGQDDIPRGPLFQSLVDDGLAMKSLKSLRESRTDLEGVERALEQLQVRFERIQSERRDETAEAQHELAEKIGTLTRVSIILSLITLLVGVLAIAAQLYGNAGKTIIVVLIILVACLAITSMTVMLLGRRFPGFVGIWPWVRREESG